MATKLMTRLQVFEYFEFGIMSGEVGQEYDLESENQDSSPG